MNHLIVLSLAVALVGCAKMPANVDLSSYLTTQPGIAAANRRVQRPMHEQSGANAKLEQRNRLLQIAQNLERNGNYEAAIGRYVQLTDAYPNDVESLHHLAVLQDKYGDPGKSARCYLRALQYTPHNADLICDYGYSRYVQGDLVQAELLLRRATELDAYLARGHNNLALTLAELGKDEAAMVEFERAGLSRRSAQENLRQARIARRLSSSQQPKRIAMRDTSQ